MHLHAHTYIHTYMHILPCTHTHSPRVALPSQEFSDIEKDKKKRKELFFVLMHLMEN